MIDYESFEEYASMRSKLKETYKEIILPNILEMDSVCFWEIRCYDSTSNSGYEAFMKLYKNNKNYEQVAQSNARSIAYGMTSATIAFIKLQGTCLSYDMYAPPHLLNPRNKIRLLNFLCSNIDEFDTITQGDRDDFMDVNFVGEELLPRTKVQLALAMGLHKTLGRYSLISQLSTDILRDLCNYLD